MFKTLKALAGLGPRMSRDQKDQVERIVEFSNAVLKAFNRQATIAGNHFLIEQAINDNHPVDIAILMICQTAALETKSIDDLVDFTYQGIDILEGLKEYKDRGIITEDHWGTITSLVQDTFTPQKRTREVEEFLIKVGGSKPLSWTLPN